MQVQVMYQRNVGDEDRPAVQMVTRSVEAAALVGEDAAAVGFIHSFWVRMPWDPEHPIEYKPAPAFGF